jgi:hypothetical protein
MLSLSVDVNGDRGWLDEGNVAFLEIPPSTLRGIYYFFR